MNQTIAEIDQALLEANIGWLEIVASGRVPTSEVIKHIASIVELTGGFLDACSMCGAMPMTVNCNNAGCDK